MNLMRHVAPFIRMLRCNCLLFTQDKAVLDHFDPANDFAFVGSSTLMGPIKPVRSELSVNMCTDSALLGSERSRHTAISRGRGLHMWQLQLPLPW
jgi:hypothetical protein